MSLPLRLLAMLFMVGSCHGFRFQLDRECTTEQHPQGINVLELLAGKIVQVARGAVATTIADGVTEIVQMDPATFDTGTRAFGFNHRSERKWDRVSEGLRMMIGLGSTDPVQYGGALKVAVAEEGKVEVATSFVRQLAAPGLSGVGAEVQICENSFMPLLNGRRYAYVGGCRFIDITPDNIPNTLALLPLICDLGDEAMLNVCTQTFLCALDELKFTPQPAPRGRIDMKHHGKFTSVHPRRSCTPSASRPGLQNPLETCFDSAQLEQQRCESQGKCSFCGDQGMCCRHPGYRVLGQLTHTPEFEGDGCGKRGCHGRHCCVMDPTQDAGAVGA